MPQYLYDQMLETSKKKETQERVDKATKQIDKHMKSIVEIIMKEEESEREDMFGNTLIDLYNYMKESKNV